MRTVYVTRAGVRWRSDPYGGIVGPGGQLGQITGDKFTGYVRAR